MITQLRKYAREKLSRGTPILGLLTFGLMLPATSAEAQDHSVARQWNEVQIEAIRGDTPRPTVHAQKSIPPFCCDV